MKRFKNILCVLEIGKVYKPALDRAIALALNNQATLTVVSVAPKVTAGIGMPEGGPISADLQAALVAAQDRELDAMIAPYRKRIDIQKKILVGTLFLEVVREVLRSEHDLVIKIPEQLDWLDRVFGSNDMHLLRKCPCPVWLLKQKEPKAYRRILAAVDVDDGYPASEMVSRQALNRQIVEMASSLALAEFAELHLVHAWEAIGERAMRDGRFMSTPEDQVDAYIKQVKQCRSTNLDMLVEESGINREQNTPGDLELKVHLVKGWARKEIPRVAEKIRADLIVMGTVARTGVPGFVIGNTAETILNQINCSVLAIKPPEFVSPITLEG